ncbi:hypothetical protein AAVH_31079 [Aphelenchoides avenae]|nr:hypothetical protein AAVH_31079 [Aphelenchus avenae]
MSSEDVGCSSPLDAVIDRSRTPACPWTPWIRLQRRRPPASRRCARAKELSRIDRGRHASRLDYKTVYVLRDGYKTFFESGFMEHCHPQGYVNMRQPFHLGELEKYNVDKENSGSSCGAEQTPTISGLHQSNCQQRRPGLAHALR